MFFLHTGGQIKHIEAKLPVNVDAMATARTANPMIGLNKPANGQLKGQMGLLSGVQQSSALQKKTSVPQSSGGIK